MQRREILFWGILLALIVVALETISAVALRYAPLWAGRPVLTSREHDEAVRRSVEEMLADRPDTLAVFDATLGWRPRPGLATDTDVINAQGLRSSREYPPAPAPGTIRVAAFGDSFVYGSEVSGGESWPVQWQQLRPCLEVLNYGVPGYGPDQAYLRFVHEGRALHPDAAIFAVTTPALRRMLSVTAVFQSATPDFLAKPRFVLDAAGELVLLPNPLQHAEEARRLFADPAKLRALGEHDYWYSRLVHENPLYDWSRTVRVGSTLASHLWRRFLDPDRPLAGASQQARFNAESTGFEILTALLRSFVVRSHAWGIEPIVVLLPDGYSVESARVRGTGILDPVASWCHAEGLACLDATAAFLEADRPDGIDAWFLDRFHHSPAGHALVAQWLDRELGERLTGGAAGCRTAP